MKDDIVPSFVMNGLLENSNDARYKKLLKIFGNDWFEGKNILEVGAGHGTIGIKLKEKKANVVFTDGYEKHVEVLKARGHEAYVMDQDKIWTIDRKFDIILHFSVLYHLKEWKQDLICAMETAPIVVLETEVTNDVEDLVLTDPNNWDQAINGIGIRPAWQNIESHIIDQGRTFVRYDDSDISVGGRNFTWKSDDENTKGYNENRRRFYVIRIKS